MIIMETKTIAFMEFDQVPIQLEMRINQFEAEGWAVRQIFPVGKLNDISPGMMVVFERPRQAGVEFDLTTFGDA